MQFSTLAAALFLGSAAAMSPEMMNNKMGEANMKMDMAARQEMAQGGATLGSLLAALDTIVGQVGDKVSGLQKPAMALQDAIKDFEDAAKDAKAPEDDKKDN